MEREKRGAFDNTRQPTSLRYSARAPVPPARRRLRADKFEMFRPLVGELLTVFQKSKTLGVLELDKGSQNLILGPVQRWEVQGLTTAGPQAVPVVS